jgi:hypothetical protein
MKVGVTTRALRAALVVGSLGLVPQRADAQQMQTTFTFAMKVGGVVTPLTYPTPEGKRILLPAAFSRWNCGITPAFISNDGKQVYRNVVCNNVDDKTLVGVSVSCNRNAPDNEHGTFFLRSGMNVNVDLAGNCVTAPAAQANPANGTKTL